MVTNEGRALVKEGFWGYLITSFRGLTVLATMFVIGLTAGLALVGWWTIPAQVHLNTENIDILNERLDTTEERSAAIERKIDYQICSQSPRPNAYTRYLLGVDCSKVPQSAEPST